MSIFLAAMVLLTFIQVILRFLFNSGLVWSLEATVYCFAWLVLIGISQGVREGSHIAVVVLLARLSPTGRKLASLVALCLGGLYALLMLYGSATFVSGLYTVGHDARDIPVPRWALVSILPVGFALLFLRLVQLGRRVWTDDESAPGIGRGAS